MPNENGSTHIKAIAGNILIQEFRANQYAIYGATRIGDPKLLTAFPELTQLPGVVQWDSLKREDRERIVRGLRSVIAEKKSALARSRAEVERNVSFAHQALEIVG
jgi:hypothetical protein